MSIKVTACCQSSEEIAFLNGETPVGGSIFFDAKGGVYSPAFVKAMKKKELDQDIWTLHTDGYLRSGAYTGRSLAYVVIPTDSLGSKEIKAPAILMKMVQQ